MYKLTLFACFLAVFTFSSCKEADITPENNKEFPITIEVKQGANGLEITWPEVKINGFENYVLQRKGDSTNVFNQFTDTVWMIDDFTRTKIIDRNLPLSGKIYYKLGVVTKDRLLESNQVAFKRNDIFSFENLNYNYIIANPTKSLVYLVSTSSQTIRAINIETGVLGKEVTIPGIGNNTFLFRQEDPDNIYAITGEEIRVYDAVTLGLKATLKNSDYPNSNFFRITSSNGKYYVSMSSYPLIIRVFDNKGPLEKIYTTTHNISYQMDIRVLPNQKKLILFDASSSSNNEGAIILLDDNGNIKSNNKVTNNSNVFGAYLWSIAPNGENMVLNSKYVFNKNLSLIATIAGSSSSNGNPLLYSPDSKYLLSDNGFFDKSILETDKFEVVSTVPLKNSSTTNTFHLLTNNEIITLSELFTGGSFGQKRLIITKAKFL